MKMYSKFNAILLVVLVFSVTIQSCSKGEFTASPTSEELEASKKNCQASDLGFTNMLEGQMHNDLVMLITENYSICSNNTDQITAEIKQILRNNSQSIVASYGMDFEAFQKLVDTAEFDLANAGILAPGFSPIAYIENHNSFSLVLKNKMIGLVELLDEIDNKASVGEIQEAICLYYDENVVNLVDDTDKKYFGSMVDVALFSTAFWSPSENGGANGYYDFKNTTAVLCAGMASEQLDFRINWGKVISSDAVGMVAGATRAVLSNPALAVPNPALGGIPTAGVIGLVSGAASSVMAGIGGG